VRIDEWGTRASLSTHIRSAIIAIPGPFEISALLEPLSEVLCYGDSLRHTFSSFLLTVISNQTSQHIIDVAMSVSVLDSRIFRNLFGTEEVREIFTDEAYTRRMIEVETALARVQSRLSVIPLDAGEVITAQAKVEKIEYVELL